MNQLTLLKFDVLSGLYLDITYRPLHQQLYNNLDTYQVLMFYCQQVDLECTNTKSKIIVSLVLFFENEYIA